MKKLLGCFLCVTLLVFGLSISAVASPIEVDYIVYQPDATLNPSDLSATVDMSISGNTLSITLTNTTTTANSSDFPSGVILTGIGFNMDPTILSGSFFSEPSTNFAPDDANWYWGYGSTNNFSTPLTGWDVDINNTVSTLTAYVDNAFESTTAYPYSGNPFAGPNHGIINDAYSTTFPVIWNTASIQLELDGTVPAGFLNLINSGDVVVAFGSPTATVPEPATILLLGSGLVGLAGFGRKRFKK